MNALETSKSQQMQAPPQVLTASRHLEPEVVVPCGVLSLRDTSRKVKTENSTAAAMDTKERIRHRQAMAVKKHVLSIEMNRDRIKPDPLSANQTRPHRYAEFNNDVKGGRSSSFTMASIPPKLEAHGPDKVNESEKPKVSNVLDEESQSKNVGKSLKSVGKLLNSIPMCRSHAVRSENTETINTSCGWKNTRKYLFWMSGYLLLIADRHDNFE